MLRLFSGSLLFSSLSLALLAADPPPPFPADPRQDLERTCFQTGQAFSPNGDLRSDVAICYGIDRGLPARIQSWRDRGYRIHVMTGVAWGQYQEYVSGRFDGTSHADEAQMNRSGRPHAHGDSKDIFYMCPGTNYGKFLCVGVQRALDAGAEAIHLEEPEFWVEDGYEEGFKREWQNYFGEPWQAPHSSPDAQWRASQLKYFLYRRALQQVFDYVQDYNLRSGRKVRCYVPTHSLLNYAHWRIVSPESSLARLRGCDGYIAQVWTGTSRTSNVYQGSLRERTFETAFLEYGAMQNLVRATGRRVWYLNDPIEDNPRHTWEDYRANWESTLVASLFQPEVWHFEVAPWPERVFGGRYPARSPDARPIPPPYATELQVVMHALNDLQQPRVEWDCGTTGIGVLVSDSLMFQRGEPRGSDSNLGQVYGLALPFLKRGMPVNPVQLENLTIPHYLDDFRLLALSYHGQKPLTPEVHPPLTDWVRRGGVLLVCDDDSDPFNQVREWWNTGDRHFATPREDLFAQLGIHPSATNSAATGETFPVGRGTVVWLRENPAQLAGHPRGDALLIGAARPAAERAGLSWRETNYLLLRRGPYLVAAGLDESVPGAPRELTGRFINLFDPALRVQTRVTLAPGSRHFLLDLATPATNSSALLACAGQALPVTTDATSLSFAWEGVGYTPGVLLLRASTRPQAITLDGQPLAEFEYSEAEKLLWIHAPNEARRRNLSIRF